MLVWKLYLKSRHGAFKVLIVSPKGIHRVGFHGSEWLLWPEKFWGFVKQQDEINNLVLAWTRKVPRERVSDLEEADIQEVLNKHAAQLSEQITVFIEPEYEDLCAFVETPQLTANAVKKCLQLVDVLVHYVFEVNHSWTSAWNLCTRWRLWLPHAWRCVMACESQQSSQRSLVSVFYLSLHHALCHSVPLTLSSQKHTHRSRKHQHIFLCLVVIYLHIIRFHVLWYL